MTHTLFDRVTPLVLALVAMVILAGQTTATPLHNSTTVVYLPVKVPVASNSSTGASQNSTVTKMVAHLRVAASDGVSTMDIPFMRTAIWYNIGTRRCLDLAQDRKNDLFADAQMKGCNRNMDAQEFQLYGSWDKLYILSRDQVHCLDVAEGKAFRGQVVRFWKCNFTGAQIWAYDKRTAHITSSLNRRLCLDPIGGNANSHDGQGMQLWPCVLGETGHEWITHI